MVSNAVVSNSCSRTFKCYKMQAIIYSGQRNWLYLLGPQKRFNHAVIVCGQAFDLVYHIQVYAAWRCKCQNSLFEQTLHLTRLGRRDSISVHLSDHLLRETPIWMGCQFSMKFSVGWLYVCNVGVVQTDSCKLTAQPHNIYRQPHESGCDRFHLQWIQRLAMESRKCLHMLTIVSSPGHNELRL